MKALGRLAILVAGCLLAPVFAFAQPPIGPRIQFNTENYDFEKILAGNPVKFTFIATNTGDATLEISNAKGSCTCTVVGDGPNKNVWTLQKVEPGQICRIPIEIATANYPGANLSKFVSVTSNDKTRPVVNLQIHGNVWMPIDVSPRAVVFHLTDETATNSTEVFKISNRMDTPLTLSDPTVAPNTFSVSLTTNVPGQEFELTVTAAPPSQQSPITATTTIQGMVSVVSSCPQMTPLQIGVYETITPAVTVYPLGGIQLFPGPLPQAMTNLVAVRGNTADLKLSAPAINASGVGISVNTVQTNRQYNIMVVFPKGFELPSGQDVALTVKTDNARFPVLSIPITAMHRQVLPPPQTTPNSLLPPLTGTNASIGSARVNPPHQ